MIAYIVTREPAYAERVRRALPADALEGVKIIAAGSLSSVKSMARSILAVEQIPVAIVFDAHTTVQEVIDERRQAVEEIVGMVAPVPFGVFLAVPDLETVCAQGPDAPF